MAIPNQITGRYEIRDRLGEGGMGVVYDAYDKIVRRRVALKTLRDAPTRMALDLFYKECDVLASMSHPNIVEIFDIGEFEEDGASKPYFVMPLLPGTTLEALIANRSNRLSVERAVEILCQTCRGLQAAHDRGLIHRDLKPSNIFVMDDDSVKIIDFGVAHMADTRSTMGHRGTLLYMAPEQVELKQASSLSDIFALGVVCFETLTFRHPFERSTASDVVAAILKHIPPSVSELNPSVNTTIGRVIHKAMAKQSWHRFQKARELGDALAKAGRNEPIEAFDPGQILPRVERAQKAFDQGDLQFADEILSELEAEGHTDPSMNVLRRQLDQSRRQKLIAQLLESARTRADQEEYPLALQKLQELLVLDPSNGAALALKKTIEDRRSDHKVEEWFRLARQHMDQNAFGHARQALQNVLELKPGDTRAFQLVSDMDRREQEANRSRQEKEDLYAKALEAWQNGEVSVALTKLELLVDINRRTTGMADTERSATFQNFYNEVRQEHDSTRRAYEQARKYAVEGDHAAALKLVNEQLTRRPGQALFQALKLDVEEAQRQHLSARIAEVDRKVESEPDLEKRVNLLSEALERHPGEPHFVRMLQTMREKRDLVNAIVSKAQALEERGQFTESLAQWEILQAIYGQYPGLDFELERTRRRRDQQLRGAAKSRSVEQIDWQMDAGDFTRASELLREALNEFPGDAELAELAKLVEQGSARAAEAQKLMAEGQSLCRARKFEEGVAALRRAQELDPKSAAVRGALTGTLVEQARACLDQDWQAAEALAQQALTLDASSAQAKSLRTLALDRKREQDVDRAVAQARRLQGDGQAEAALGEVDRALAEHPRDPRLSQLRTTLTKTIRETQAAETIGLKAPPPKPVRPQSLRESLSETMAMVPEAPPLVTPVAQPEPPKAVEPVAIAPPAPPEPVPPPPPPPPPHPVEEPPAVQPPVVEPPKQEAPKPAPPKSATAKSTKESKSAASKRTAAPAIPAPPVAATPKPEPPAPEKPKAAVPPPPPPAPRKLSPALIAGGVAAILLVVGAIIVIPKLKRSTPAVAVAPQPTGPAVPDAAAPVKTSLRVLGDLEGAKVTLDDAPIGEIQDGQLSIDTVPPGKHSLKIANAQGQASVELDALAGAVPSVASVTAKEVIAVTVASMGENAKVVSSAGPAKVQLDHKPAGETGASGLNLTGLAAGNHDLTVGEGKDLRSMVVGIGATPMLTVFLKSDRNAGTLVLMTGEDGVTVFLDGKPYRRQTQRGQLRIPNLAVKDYVVRVVKDGFVEIPEQHIAIAKGEELKLELKMKPVARMASLTIQGAVPGAQVLLDETPIGVVQDDGSFSASSVAPGQHAIEFRKDSYRPKKIEKRFEAGSAVEIAAAESAMDKVPATLKLRVTPPDAHITISRGNESPKAVSESSLTLAEGTYTIQAQAANYTDRSATVVLAAGETKTVELALAKVVTAAAPRGMSDWDDAAGWTAENGWFVRKGGNFVGYKASQTAGTFVFSADLRKGKRLQWVINHTDAKNYVLFQMDKKFFYRTVVVNGKEKELTKVPYTAPKGNAISIQMEVSGDSVINRMLDSGKWLVVDAWPDAGRAFSTGQFGFLVSNGDTLAISNFSFTPR